MLSHSLNNNAFFSKQIQIVLILINHEFPIMAIDVIFIV